ncbi:PadR family transcriptional regulator [Brachybacterium sp. AOP42-C2-15]|uniref:PadR family transcriptional regulator n=1 Tax=unclassified Brachybacterium TaxID=2623841 RepID=UPI003F939FD2
MTSHTDLSAEDAEWVEELARSWIEVYKKSATTLALLRIVGEHGPISATGIAPHFANATGWTLTDRGLYRTLRRLAESGVLSLEKVDVARTGAKRQDFALTAMGRAHLERIENELI